MKGTTRRSRWNYVFFYFNVWFSLNMYQLTHNIPHSIATTYMVATTTSIYYRHQHQRLRILLPLPPTPTYMISTISDASVYDYYQHLRIWSPPLPTTLYIIAATSEVSVYDRIRHFRILSPPLPTTPYIASVYCLCISPPYLIATTTDTSVHILSPLTPTPDPHRRVDCSRVPPLPPNTTRNRRVVDCAGVWNYF